MIYASRMYIKHDDIQFIPRAYVGSNFLGRRPKSFWTSTYISAKILKLGWSSQHKIQMFGANI